MTLTWHCSASYRCAGSHHVNCWWGGRSEHSYHKLSSTWTLEDFHKKGRAFKTKQKRDFDRRHGTHPLTPLPDNTDVWVTSGLPNSEPSRGQVVTPCTSWDHKIVHHMLLEGGGGGEIAETWPQFQSNQSHHKTGHPLCKDSRLRTVERSLTMTCSQTRTVTRQPSVVLPPQKREMWHDLSLTH